MTSWSSIKEVSKRCHQNFLLCNNNEITACIADLCNSFCEEIYEVAFFKVMQQQTIGEVANSITRFNVCTQIMSVCNSFATVKIRQCLRKLCLNEKRSSFLTQCTYRQTRQYINYDWQLSMCIIWRMPTNVWIVYTDDVNSKRSSYYALSLAKGPVRAGLAYIPTSPCN